MWSGIYFHFNENEFRNLYRMFNIHTLQINNYKLIPNQYFLLKTAFLCSEIFHLKKDSIFSYLYLPRNFLIYTLHTEFTWHVAGKGHKIPIKHRLLTEPASIVASRDEIFPALLCNIDFLNKQSSLLE